MKRSSFKIYPAAKTQMRLSTRYIVTGVALIVTLVSIGTFIFLNLGNSRDAMAAGGSANAVTGSWASASTWSFNRLPGNGDVLTIPVGVTVTFSNNRSYVGLTLHIYGTLNFTNGDKLNLDNTSVINVYAGGKIIGGNNGSVITIGTQDYKGEFNFSGPIKLTSAGNVTLPIRLLSFTAQTTAKGVEIKWITAKEENNAYFTIEKSTDAAIFTALQKVKGAGTSSEKLSYQAIDQNKVTGLVYYRLRQTDIDGKSTVSKIVSVNNDASADANGTSDQTMTETASLTVNKVGPNPFLQDFFVDFDLISEGLVAVQLTDMQGRVVETKTLDGVEGNNRYEFVDNQGLKPGIYIFSMKHRNSSKVIRLMKR